MDEGENKPRASVLVASPTYDAMRYCFREFIDSLKAINFDKGGFDILLMDNSKKEEFFNELKMEKGIIALKDDTKEDKNVRRLVSSRNKILDYAILNNYEYVLMMDSDVIPPKEILRSLVECDKDIVSGLYFGEFSISGKIKELPVAWKLFSEEEFNEMKRLKIAPEYAKRREDIRRHITDEEANSGALTEVFICSPGCMLLSRKVFEKIRYDFLEKGDGILYGDDIAFLEMARKHGFKIWCNTKVKCRHLFKGKMKNRDGELVHPMYE